MISKTDLRKHFIEKRKSLDTKYLSEVICNKIYKSEIYKNAKTVFAYYPMKYEVDISPLFKDTSKQWFLPKTTDYDLIFCEYKIGDELIKSKFGVLEPTNNKTDITPDLIIVPALCVDEGGYRLGYGKGFYDRFLDSFITCPLTLTPVFSDLIIEKLPIDKYDKTINIIVSD